jgi:UDP-N-acetylglucosamine--N-acetylmuramyl-(pentapeptide) pyrophosphoryl-undecaprenol N-acetylglucosamine transferase
VFAKAGASLVFRQSELTADLLKSKVLYLLGDAEYLKKMSQAASQLAVTDSAERLANLVRQFLI